MPFTYEFPAHYVAADIVIFGADTSRTGATVSVLLIQRADDPFAGQWAIPGGFVEPDEDLEDAARRELREETGVEGAFLEQLYTFGAPRRDPRARVISVSYFALVKRESCQVEAGSDAASAAWFPIESLPILAFDHRDVLDKAIARLRMKARYEPIGFNLLPERFTIKELYCLYGAIMGTPIGEVDAFRRAFERMDLLEPAGTEKRVQHRPAKLYRFNKRRYDRLVKRGFNFEI